MLCGSGGKKKTSNGKDTTPLLCHFDVNKTIIQSDTIQYKSVDQGVREGISELYWGTARKGDDNKIHWEWTGHKEPSCGPPRDDVIPAGTRLLNYAEYCKEAIKDKATCKETIRNFSLVEGEVKDEMERLRQLALKKMQLDPEVHRSKEALACGLKGPTLQMFPTIFHLAASLQRGHRPFAFIFRSFGADHDNIKSEWNAFCDLKHPIFSQLIKDIGPMNGTKPGIPDRRINGIHTLYRDQQGPVLLLDTFTNGPGVTSWDDWVKTKPKPQRDERKGREFIKSSGSKTVEGYANISKWTKNHLSQQATAAIKDDWAWWQFHGEQASAGKLLMQIGDKRRPIHQVFFDDNIGTVINKNDDARIVDCRECNGSPMTHSKVSKICVKVNPVEAMLDQDYFLRKLLLTQDDQLDPGQSIIGLQNRLTETEDEMKKMRKQLHSLKGHLKTVSEENRRIKQKAKMPIRDVEELQEVLGKDGDTRKFCNDEGLVNELYTELDQGLCWLEKDEMDRLVRCMEMVFLRIEYTVSGGNTFILIESNEVNDKGRHQSRNFFPGVAVSTKDNSSGEAIDRWLETGLRSPDGLQVDLRRSVDIVVPPAPNPEIAEQKTLLTTAYDMTCVVQQNIASLIIPEKEVDIHRDLFGRIGLPACNHFHTTDIDAHGREVNRFWRWERTTTWEAAARAGNAGGGQKIDVGKTCEKIFGGNPNKDVYSRIVMDMFHSFDAQKLAGGFSGSVVVRVQPFENSGRPGDPCIVKLDAAKAIEEEYDYSMDVFNALPDRAARCISKPVKGKDAQGKEFGALQLELAGACWNVAELAMGSTNLLVTFKDLLIYEAEQVLMSSNNQAQDTRPFGNVNSILAETFGPGGVVSALRNGGKKKGPYRDDKSLLGQYTLKGKDSDCNPLTPKADSNYPYKTMKKLYRDYFKEDLPDKALKETMKDLKTELDRLAGKAGKDLYPTIGLAHGDLNAANIMIDAVEAVWLIDFATSVDLPLFTDMCKFEMACLFEYAIIPITPKMLLDFAGKEETDWKKFSVNEWLRVDETVAAALLKNCVKWDEKNQLSNLNPENLRKLIEEAINSSGIKAEKQSKNQRSLTARLCLDEATTEVALSYCMNISQTLIGRDTPEYQYLFKLLDMDRIPLPEGREGRGIRGASSLRFFVEVAATNRRFMSKDVMGLLRDPRRKNQHIAPVDILSLQLWLPFLREAYRIIGYRDVAPQFKLWSIYHLNLVSKNVKKCLETVKQCHGKSWKIMDMWKNGPANDTQGTPTTDEEKNGEERSKMESESRFYFSHATEFPPQDKQYMNIVRKMFEVCNKYNQRPGFYVPVWQVLNDRNEPLQLTFQESVTTTPSTLAPSRARHTELAAGAQFSSKSVNTPWDLKLEPPSDDKEYLDPVLQQGLGSLTPKQREVGQVYLKSRLLPVCPELLKLHKDAAYRPKEDEKIFDNANFSLSAWSGGVLHDNGELQAAKRTSTANSQVKKQLGKFLNLKMKAIDEKKKTVQERGLRLVVGEPVCCYPPGSLLCLDANDQADGNTLESVVVMSLVDSGTDSGSYSVDNAERPFFQSGAKRSASGSEFPEFHRMLLPPGSHTYIASTSYNEGDDIIIRKLNGTEWYDAKVLAKPTNDSGFRYKLEVPASGEDNYMMILHRMNSSKQANGFEAGTYDEEVVKIRSFFRARHKNVIDSLSGARLDVKQNGQPTLSVDAGGSAPMTASGSIASSAISTRPTTSTKAPSQSYKGARFLGSEGWQALLQTVAQYERMVPTCKANAFLIQGKPGSGKSCLIYRFIMESLDRHQSIVPMVVPVADLVKRSTHDVNLELSQMQPDKVRTWFDRYLRTTWGEDSLRYSMVKQAIEMRRVVFLFDGLEDSGNFKREIEACIKELMQDMHLVVVTSRPWSGGQIDLEVITEHVMVMRLEPLLDEQKQQIANARLSNSTGNNTGMEMYKAFTQKLRQSKGMQDGGAEDEEGEDDVFGNPMMLSMLVCYIQTSMRKAEEREQDDPNEPHDQSVTLTAVYRVALDVILQRLQSSSMAERFDKERKMDQSRQILEGIARAMMIHNDLKDEIDLKYVDDQFGEHGRWPKAMGAGDDHKGVVEINKAWENLKAAVQSGSAMFLRMIENTSNPRAITNTPNGIIESSPKAQEEPLKLQFLDKGFRDYFAANSASRHGGQWAELDFPSYENLINEPRWAKTLEMLAEANPTKYIEIIEGRLPPFIEAQKQKQGKDKTGDTFLHLAARHGHRPIFQLLRHFHEAHRKVLHVTNDKLRTPLHLAAEKGHTAVCQAILDCEMASMSQADKMIKLVEAEDADDLLAMHLAMRKGNFTTAKFLLQQNPSLGQKKASKKSGNQLEILARKILDKNVLLSEQEFKGELNKTFPELEYYTPSTRLHGKMSAAQEASNKQLQNFQKATYCGLYCVYWITADKYDKFTRTQTDPKQKMKHDDNSWGHLVAFAEKKARMRDRGVLMAMLVLTAIGNIGRIQELRKVFGVEDVEFTQALAIILQKQPMLCPSFSRLDEYWQQSILQALRLQADFNFGQFLQAEMVPASLVKAKTILSESGSGSGDRGTDMLGFFLLRNVLTMCAIFAFKDETSSAFMTETQYSVVKMGCDTLMQDLETQSPPEVYEAFLSSRAYRQGLTFSSYSPEARAIVRVACMCANTDPSGGKQTKEAFEALNHKSREKLTKYLNADGVVEKPSFLIYGSPALVKNARSNNKLGITLGLKVLLSVYEAAQREYEKSGEQVITIHCAQIAEGPAKNSNDPESFENLSFEIARTAGDEGAKVAHVRISPWQIVNDEKKLKHWQEEAEELPSIILNHSIKREPQFLKKIYAAFPELEYLRGSTDDEAKDILAKTRCAFLVIFWTITNQVDAFTAYQPADKKLSENSWKKILQTRDQALGDEKKAEVLHAVLVMLAIQGLGKLRKFGAQLAPKASNHHEVLSTVLEERPKMMPSYWMLGDSSTGADDEQAVHEEPSRMSSLRSRTSSQRTSSIPNPFQRRQGPADRKNWKMKLVRECLTRQFSFKHFLSAESVPACASRMKELIAQDSLSTNGLDGSQSLKVWLFSVFAEVAASHNAPGKEGSVYMTDESWKEFEIGVEAMQHLHHEDEVKLFDRILEKRARLASGTIPWSPEPGPRAYARLACICNVTDANTGTQLVEAWEDLHDKEHSELVKYLSADGINEKPGYVLKGCRSFMMTALQRDVIKPALRVLLKVYQQVANMKDISARQICEIHFNKLAEFTKGFTGSKETFQDLSFQLERIERKDDTEVPKVEVIPKVWIPISRTNAEVLNDLREKGVSLASKVRKKNIDEKNFLRQATGDNGKSTGIYPELSYFKVNSEPLKRQTHGAMLAIFWLVSGNYTAFTKCQAGNEQLTRQSWGWIQEWILKKMDDDNKVDAMLAFMAIHALGKIEEFRDELAPGFSKHMHDRALLHILETNAEVIPTYLRLSEKYQKLIKDSLSVEFEFSQFLQAENVPANLSVVKDRLGGDEDSLGFFCFRIFVQMCGKMGSKSLNGSLFMTEPQFQRFKPGLDALEQLRTQEAGAAYNSFIRLQGSKALARFASPEHQALARLMCLGAASDAKHGEELCNAFDGLGKRERTRLIEWLTADGISEKPGYVLCDAPRYLDAAQKNQKSVGLTKALRKLLGVKDMCRTRWGVHKVYIHLDNLADWAQDAGGESGDFDEARLTTEQEDVDTSRIFRVQVQRPDEKRRDRGGASCKNCCWCFWIAALLVLVCGSIAGLLALQFLPEEVAPYKKEILELSLPLFTGHKIPGHFILKALVGILSIALLLLIICCFGCRCRCCGSRPGFFQNTSSRRPLLCKYTPLVSDDSIV